MTANHRYARVLELVDPSVSMTDVDRPPVVIPRRLTLDGRELPDGTFVVEIDGIHPADEWPVTITLAVPRDAVRYVVTRVTPDGVAINGRVWIGDIEVCTPIDPISYPVDTDTAYVDIHVDEFRVGADRSLELV